LAAADAVDLQLDLFSLAAVFGSARLLERMSSGM